VDDDDDNIAAIAIDEDDYDSIPAGVYHHELWDDDAHALLAFGDAYLGEGTEPVA
jgi:cupin superfamily acireductone dioxygenase involved in methionine salvage